MRRYVYDLVPPRSTGWMRLRDDGHDVTLAVKDTGAENGLSTTSEVEVSVGGFDEMHAVLEALGHKARGYQVNYRQSFRKDGVRIEIDEWPLLPPYIEVEADSAGEVYSMCKTLGFKSDELVTLNTISLYRAIGIELMNTPILRFD
jgi:adenylate cyclase class 2